MPYNIDEDFRKPYRKVVNNIMEPKQRIDELEERIDKLEKRIDSITDSLVVLVDVMKLITTRVYGGTPTETPSELLKRAKNLTEK